MAEESCDIYDNLPDFKYDETLGKLQSLVNKLTCEVKELKVKLSEAKKENTELETKCSLLAKNFSSLFKTATAEIERKDNMLSELRARLNDGRRTRINSPPFKRQRLLENNKEPSEHKKGLLRLNGHGGRSEDSKPHDINQRDRRSSSERRKFNTYSFDFDGRRHHDTPRVVDYRRSNGYSERGSEQDLKKHDENHRGRSSPIKPRKTNGSRESRDKSHLNENSKKREDEKISVERKRSDGDREKLPQPSTTQKLPTTNTVSEKVDCIPNEVGEQHIEAQGPGLIPISTPDKSSNTNKMRKNQGQDVTSRVPNVNLPNLYTKRMFKKIYGPGSEQSSEVEKGCTLPIITPSKNDARHLPFAENTKEKQANSASTTPSPSSCPKENKENVTNGQSIKTISKIDRSSVLLHKNRPIGFEESSIDSIKFESVLSKSETKSPKAERKKIIRRINRTQSGKKKISPVCIKRKKVVEKEGILLNKTVELFGSPVKWTEDSMEPAIDLPPTVYEDSCSAQIENLNFMSDEKGRVEFAKPVTPNKIVKPHSIFSPNINISQSSHSFVFTSVRQPSIDKKPMSARNLGIEDSFMGQFETTTQFISSLTEVKGKISPLSTPLKSNESNFILDKKDTKTGLRLKQIINKNGEQELIYVHSPRKNPRTYNSISSDISPKKDSTNSKCSISESFFHLKEKDLLSLEDKPHKILQTSNFKRPIMKSQSKGFLNDACQNRSKIEDKSIKEQYKQDQVKATEPIKWVLYPVQVSEYKGIGKWDWNNSNQKKAFSESTNSPIVPSINRVCKTAKNDTSCSANKCQTAAHPRIVLSRQRRPNFGRKTIVDNISVKLK